MHRPSRRAAASTRFVFVEDRLRHCHHFSVWNAGFLRRHRTLDLGAEPRVIRSGVLTGSELRLDWGKAGHIMYLIAYEHNGSYTLRLPFEFELGTI